MSTTENPLIQDIAKYSYETKSEDVNFYSKSIILSFINTKSKDELQTLLDNVQQLQFFQSEESLSESEMGIVDIGKSLVYFGNPKVDRIETLLQPFSKLNFKNNP